MFERWVAGRDATLGGHELPKRHNFNGTFQVRVRELSIVAVFPRSPEDHERLISQPKVVGGLLDSRLVYPPVGQTFEVRRAEGCVRECLTVLKQAKPIEDFADFIQLRSEQSIGYHG